MFKTVALSLPGALRPETRQALINTSVRYIAEELQAMPGVLKEMDPRQRGQLRRALEEAVGAIDVHADALNGLTVRDQGCRWPSCDCAIRCSSADLGERVVRAAGAIA